MNKDLHPTLICALASNFPFPCRPHSSNYCIVIHPFSLFCGVHPPFNLSRSQLRTPPFFRCRAAPNPLHVKFDIICRTARQPIQFSNFLCSPPPPTPPLWQVVYSAIQYSSLFCTLCPRPKESLLCMTEVLPKVKC